MEARNSSQGCLHKAAVSEWEVSLMRALPCEEGTVAGLKIDFLIPALWRAVTSISSSSCAESALGRHRTRKEKVNAERWKHLISRCSSQSYNYVEINTTYSDSILSMPTTYTFPPYNGLWNVAKVIVKLKPKLTVNHK